MHGEAEPLFALFELSLCPAPGLALFGVAQRPLDGRHQPRSILLQYIIDRALLERLDGAFLADGAGDEYEGCVGAQQLRDLQRIGAVESRQCVVGQDEIRRESRERLFVHGAAVHAAADEVQTLQAHFAQQYFRVLHAVLDEQDLDFAARAHRLGMRFMTVDRRICRTAIPYTIGLGF